MKSLIVKLVCMLLIVLTAGILASCRPDVQSEGLMTDFRSHNDDIVTASIGGSDSIVPVRKTPKIGDSPSGKAHDDVMSKLSEMADTRQFAEALRRAGLDAALSGKGPYTVFVPVDKAFDDLPYVIKKIMTSPDPDIGNKERLINVLHYHVMLQQIKTTDMNNQSKRPTAKGDLVVFSRSPQVTKVLGVRARNDATIIRENITCSNGVIHIVDQVLIPGNTDYRDKRKDLLKR